MSKSHNKKRNVGIIYEQLINYISQTLVEGKKKETDTAIEIIRKNFRPGTELYKEFRLFNALVKTHVASESLATRILSEAKRAAQDHDSKKLRSEKSQLIREINHNLCEGSNLYSRRIENYTTYATIQTLLNDWRSKEVQDISRVALYESKIHGWLLKEKEDLELDEQKTSNVNRLTVKLLEEKFNKKYQGTLSKKQKKILKSYAFSSDDANDKELKESLEKLKNDVLKNIKKFSHTCENKTLNKKISKVSTLIESLDEVEYSDTAMSRHLLLSKLNEELEGKDNV